MGQNPLVLVMRFLLEMVALLAIGYWGWTRHAGVLRLALAISVPLIAAVLWAIFRVPGDTSGGPPVVAVPGLVRLLLELAFFGLAIWCLYASGLTIGAWLYGGLVLFHYLISYDRIRWLMQQ